MNFPAAVVVREFTAGDVAAANALTNYYIANTAIHFATAPATDDEFRAGWELTRGEYPWLAADVAGTFAGYAKAYRWRERAAYARTAEAGLYVTPACQGRGVGRTLYGELLQRLRRLGFHTVIGGVALPNAASVRLHETLGFRAVGVFRAVGHKFGRWHDVAFWQYDLA